MERSVNDSNFVPSSAPASDSNSTDDPSPTPSSSASNSDDTKVFGWFLFWIILIPIAAFILWRLWKRYRRRYEQRMLDYRSAQADRVLGDMQMVPNEDLDNELI
jgi:hypothetical protein